ncbi:organelle RRM domain-containing protein 1, chloroplastic [Impatiens glandulifera]|uniref:organelle RRM domain-containing protein 1, chloroplastic n=1 Tax=Impatiens glandulifera TaxID=253017 RepID=UPI001FB0A609|nr:organelle RRM domain-containing protein 1, chloroplastic [Impatiens glandulifera]
MHLSMESSMSLFAVVSSTSSAGFLIKHPKSQFQAHCPCTSSLQIKSSYKQNSINSSTIVPYFNWNTSATISYRTSIVSPASPPTRTTSTSPPSTPAGHRHWRVVMEAPAPGTNSKPQIIDYYVNTLNNVLGSEIDAQMCIYEASWETQFEFCCDIYEETAQQLALLPGVLSVRPDIAINSKERPFENILPANTLLFPEGNTSRWLVRLDKPSIGVVSKAQMVDYYTKLLTKVMGNEKDAQMCIYHISWQSDFGFCCELDEDCAGQLSGLPGVCTVQPDEKFEFVEKDYAGENSQQSGLLKVPTTENPPKVKTKKLFVTGLSFYTSEKTLRAAFDGFGEIVEVRIIMDKISKRSKGYAFVEYTTEEAARVALGEMNGKIINGWMITVDVAKTNPPKYSRSNPSPSS